MFWSSSSLLVIASLIAIIHAPGPVAVVLCIISIYGIFNLVRVAEGRTMPGRIAGSAYQTLAWLGLAAMLTTICWLIIWYWPPVANMLTPAALIIQLVVAVLLLASVQRQLLNGQQTELSQTVPTAEAPSITIAVPARNEDGQLAACLTAVLASDYPKLEILALDDSSDDRTPEIIRQFAQRGVRFIRGPEPKPGWLPKNRAYAELAAAASGTLLLFCGSDIRLAPGSIRRLVEIMIARHKTMLAIVPENTVSSHLPLLQAMRYYWEIVPPRRLFRRPPVLGSCWLINRQQLQQAGGFEAVRRSVTPEAYFARQAMTNGDSYSFLRSGQALGVTSEKTAIEQRETAIYSRYPQLGRRPEMVLLLTMAEAVLLIGPLVAVVLVAVSAMATSWTILPAAALGCNILAFAMTQKAVFKRVGSLTACLGFLPAIATDIYYMNYSMYCYEFGQVLWKGRNIAKPVMRKDS